MERQKKVRIVNSILKEKNKVGGLTLPNFTIFYKAIIIKIVWYWWKNRQIDQWNRIESPEINPHKLSQIIFDKGTEAIQWRKDSLFNKLVLEQLDIHLPKQQQQQNPLECRHIDTDPTFFTKISSKWIIDINVKCKTIKLLEDNIK